MSKCGYAYHRKLQESQLQWARLRLTPWTLPFAAGDGFREIAQADPSQSKWSFHAVKVWSSWAVSQWRAQNSMQSSLWGCRMTSCRYLLTSKWSPWNHLAEKDVSSAHACPLGICRGWRGWALGAANIGAELCCCCYCRVPNLSPKRCQGIREGKRWRTWWSDVICRF